MSTLHTQTQQDPGHGRLPLSPLAPSPAATRRPAESTRMLSGLHHRYRCRSHRHHHCGPARDRPWPVCRPQLAHHKRQLRHHRRHRRGQPQRHPDRLALQLDQLPPRREGRRRHRPKPTSASPSVSPSLPPRPPQPRRHGQRSRLPPERPGHLLRLRQLRSPSRCPASATQAAAYLTAHPAIKVVIGGYCDDRGSAEYNLALGENRANAAQHRTGLGRRLCQPSSRHQLRQGEAVLHGRERELLAAKPSGPILTRSLDWFAVHKLNGLDWHL